MSERFGESWEKAEEVKRLHRENPTMSRRALARAVGTSHSQIARILEDVEEQLPPPPPDLPYEPPGEPVWRAAWQRPRSERERDLIEAQDVDALVRENARLRERLAEMGVTA